MLRSFLIESIRIVHQHFSVAITAYPGLQLFKDSRIVNDSEWLFHFQRVLRSVVSISRVWPIASPDNMIWDLLGKRLDDGLQIIKGRCRAIRHAIQA